MEEAARYINSLFTAGGADVGALIAQLDAVLAREALFYRLAYVLREWAHTYAHAIAAGDRVYLAVTTELARRILAERPGLLGLPAWIDRLQAAIGEGA